VRKSEHCPSNAVSDPDNEVKDGSDCSTDAKRLYKACNLSVMLCLWAWAVTASAFKEFSNRVSRSSNLLTDDSSSISSGESAS
jgi:hypothetical protein